MPARNYYHTVWQAGATKKVQVPGVTTVIGNNLGWNKEALVRWANREGLDGRSIEESRGAACSVGSWVHASVESEIHGRPVPDFPYDWTEEMRLQATSAMVAWHEWREVHGLEVVATEQSLVSQYGFGGTFDAVRMHKGVLCLLDWKTSRRIYDENWIQIAAYGMLWTEHHPSAQPGEYHLVRIGKSNGSFEHHRKTHDELEPHRQAFTLLLGLHQVHRRML